MPPVPLRVQHYEWVVRVLSAYEEVLSGGVVACTALTNAFLEGSAGETSPGVSTLQSAVEQEACRESHVIKLFGDLNSAFSSLTTWYCDFLDAGSSLQTSMDSNAQTELLAGDSTGEYPRLRASERCCELLGELRVAFSVECTLRAGILGSILPARYHLPWKKTLLGDKGSEGESLFLPRSMESNREALTIAVASWSVSAHAEKSRVKLVLAALEEVVKR